MPKLPQFHNMSEVQLRQWVESNPEGFDDWGSDGSTPLYVAVFKLKSLPLALWLLDEKGADVNAATSQGATPVHGAFTLDLLSALLDRGADPSKLDRHGITALMSQATWGEDGAIARLLEDPRIRAIVNMRNVPGDTALHWACTHKSDKQQHAQVLLHLQAGADASIKGKKKDCLTS